MNRHFTANFYHVYNLKYNNNFIIDDIEYFLTQTSEAISILTSVNIQFQRPELKTTLKINASELEMLAPQSFLSDSSSFKRANYMSMKLNTLTNPTSDDYNNSRIYYYFILKKRWKSTQTIELDLVMDVLNTFKWTTPDVIGHLSSKTIVRREHKDRWKKVNGVTYPILDFYPEGINPVLYKKSEAIINDSLLNTSWNLVYRSGASTDPPTAAECFVMPDDQISVRTQNATDDVVLTAERINQEILGGETILFYASDVAGQEGATTNVPLSTQSLSQGQSIKIDGASYSITSSVTQTGNAVYSYKVLRITRGDAFKFNYSLENWAIVIDIHNNLVQGTITSIIDSGLCASIEIVGVNSAKCGIAPSNLANPSDTPRAYSSLTYYKENNVNRILHGINQLDKTDSRLYKIIKLPYSPFNKTKSGTIYSFDNNWQYDESFYALKFIGTSFEATITTSTSSPWHTFSQKHYTESTSRDDTHNETKLLHSDFMLYKFVYDSFEFAIPFERINLDTERASGEASIKFTFKPTTTINSKFLFDFSALCFWLYSTSDYDSVMTIARNNEVTIYNNEYLNYLRTAYHYDLKSKERTIQTARLGMGLGIASSALSGALSVASGNPAVMVSGLASAGTSIASNIVNTMNTIQAAEDQFAAKQDQLKAQSFSVSGSDDVDLMVYYTGNRLKLVRYEASDRMMGVIADLFYYCGYATNEQKIPQVKTRKWFNYLQADLVFYEEMFNEEVTEEYIRKVAEGVTFFHKNESETSKYNMIQTKENTEVAIL